MKLIVFQFIISITSIFAQEGFGVQVSYANIGTNYGYAGFDARLFGKNCLNIGTGIYATSRNNKLEILPEIHINVRPFNKNRILLDLLMTEISLTNKFINPNIGINLLNGIKVKTGYCMPYQKSDYFNGVTFGIIITVSGFKNGYVDKLNLIQ